MGIMAINAHMIPVLGSELLAPLLLLKTVDMMVRPTVPPNGFEKETRHWMGAVRLGKRARACSEPGLKERPVPNPVRAIMPYTRGRFSWLVAQASTVIPVEAVMVEITRVGWVWRGKTLLKKVAEKKPTGKFS